MLAFAASATMGLLLGVAEPSAHDEFSYLLAADTFMHGRLTNPTHPMWVHFETMHVIHQPTYMSKYMPAQGLFLALGRVLGGHPIIGVWLGMAFMCATICWMLQAWLPRSWAVLGGLFAVIHPYIGVASYWAQSYWGGAVPAAGGALVLGGVHYLTRQPRVSYALITGVGLALLANSRPYEGLVYSIPLVIASMIRLLRKSEWVVAKKVLFPLTLFGITTIAAMGYYNYRITGNFFTIPYLVHERTYGMFSYFIWQDLPRVPNSRHFAIRDYHASYELPGYLERRSLEGFLKINFSILFTYVLVTGNVFLISLIGAGKSLVAYCRRDPWGRLMVFTYVFFACGLMLETVMSLHYWAPITGMNYFFFTQSMYLWRERERRVGQAAIYAVIVSAIAVLAINAYQTVNARDQLGIDLQRPRILRDLNRGDARHLILVKYGPNHSSHNEWVYNDADIDGSKVVWARAIGPEEDCKLMQYFKDRKIWFLEIDQDRAPAHLKPFSKSCENIVSP